MAVIIFIVNLVRPAEGHHFLWRVTSPDNRAAYIMGSIHLADKGLYPLNEAIYKAFTESAILVVEVNIEDMSGEAIASFIENSGMSSDPAPLPQRLSPETRDALEKSGFYTWEMQKFQPWLAALAIQAEVMAQHGFLSQYGLDLHFIQKAKAREIVVLELETMTEQLEMMADMSPEEADLFLRAAVLELEDLPKIMRKFLQAWRTGDAEAFSQIFFQEYDKYPELLPLLDKIIVQRNKTMAARLHQMISQHDGSLFVIVGGGHLVGDDNILDILSGLGYKVQQQ